MGRYCTVIKRCPICGRPTKVATPGGTTDTRTDETGRCPKCIHNGREVQG